MLLKRAKTLVYHATDRRKTYAGNTRTFAKQYPAKK